MSTFEYSGFAQDIRFGPGSVGELSDMTARYGWQQVLFCTSGSHMRSGRASNVESALGSRRVTTVDDVQPHVQEEQVNQVLELAGQHDVDAIVALGGGSVLGMAKAVSDALQEVRTGTPARETHPLVPVLVPVVAIPTTYAGSEMTTVYGVTRNVDGTRRKITVSGRNITPRVVIYDPELTLDMPWQLSGTSAMNAMAHCFEALYSPKRNVLSTWAALGGIRALVQSMPRVHGDAHDLEARSMMLEGAFLAGAALSQVAMAIHHGVCHVLGGTAGVPHGVANTIVLPHALRFNQEAAAGELAEAAFVLELASRRDGPEYAATQVVEEIDRLARDLELPCKLGDYGVRDEDLPRLARIAFDGGPVKNNPRPIDDPGQIEDFLRAML